MKFFYTDKNFARKSMELLELFSMIAVSQKISPSCGKVCVCHFGSEIFYADKNFARKSMELLELFFRSNSGKFSSARRLSVR